MPELAEVEFYRKQWAPGFGRRVVGVEVHAGARVFRGVPVARMVEELKGSVLQEGLAKGKQILFRFSGGRWLGVHLGMTGELATEGEKFASGKHDHLILRQRGRTLVFRDPRMFGRIRFSSGIGPPEWWEEMAPGVFERGFTVQRLAEVLQRCGRMPLKALLLRQEFFPGIGNWMADEILWRCGWAPFRRAGTLDLGEVRRLWREIRLVARVALARIGKDWGELPKGWLFHCRWKDGGRCPRTGGALVRQQVGGRTTCWSPQWQKVT
ncbi:MAG: DNA-formamidopyrimidine glycosylase family protein [Verrucomicrobiia bacterium]